MARDNITNILTFLVLTIGIVLIVFFGRPLIYKDVRADITSQIVEFGGMLFAHGEGDTFTLLVPQKKVPSGKPLH
jgi:hypothetical protein